MRLRAAVLLFAFFFMVLSGFVAAPACYAETDVTDKVELVKSRLRYDRRAETSYLDVSLKNISEDVLLTPIRVVIDSISDPSVTVANLDGMTDDGKPFFLYSSDSGILSPNETTASKKWIFSNIDRARFSYFVSVKGKIPDVVGHIGPEGGTIEILDPNNPIYGTKIEVYEGAIPDGTPAAVITIRQESTEVPLPPEAYDSITPRVKITCSASLSIYAKVSLPIIGQITKDDSIVVSHQDDINNTWNTLPISFINQGSNRLEFFTPGFSTFEGIKFKNLPPNDQLNMDIFMRYEYPIEITKILNSQIKADVWTDYAKYQTQYNKNVMFCAEAMINLISANMLFRNSATAEQYADTIVDELSLTFDIVYPLIGDDSKDYIDPIVDMLKCVLVGVIKSEINHTDRMTEIGLSCLPDAGVNAINASIRFWSALQINNETKHMNETNISIEFMQLYYSTGGNLSQMADYAKANEPTENSIIEAIGEAYYKQGWFAWDDYSVDRVKQMVLNLKADVQRLRQIKDTDNDLIPEWRDLCPNTYDPNQSDSDGDGIGDACDKCPGTSDPDQIDTDSDGIGDACDTDADGDTYIDKNQGGDDCDDNNPAIHPGAQEICDGIDNDCDDSIDEGLTVTYYRDNDYDGYGDPDDSISSCRAFLGYVENSSDCDDNDPYINPEATEICGDDIDQDCNGSDLPCIVDSDNDGVPDSEDKCPNTPNPDQIDSDSDGIGDACDSDADGDTYINIDQGGDDCDDKNNAIHPGATEICGDGIDQDCNGSDLPCIVDSDNDGVSDEEDNCPDTPNPDQTDTDGDGIGDACETNLTDGLVAYYPFNGNANDESGNEQHGTVYGATLANDRFGNSNASYDFDGIDDYISIPELLTPSISSFSVSAWLKSNSSQSSTPVIYKGAKQGEASLGLNENNWEFSVKLSDQEWYYTIGELASIGSFDLVTGIYKKGECIEIWVNGELKNQTPIPDFDLHTNTFHNSSIGSYNRGGTPFLFFNGTIDDVRFYDHALSENEIQELFSEASSIDTDGDGIADAEDNCPDTPNPDQTDTDNDGIGDACESPLSDGLVAYYPFNGNANDESGYENHGLAYGATLTQDRNGNQNSAYLFDGVDDYIEIPGSDSLDTRYSISMFAWVLSDGPYGPIVNYCSDCFGVHLWETGRDCGPDALFARFVERSYTWPLYLCAGNSLPNNNEWKFVGATYDFTTGTARLFVNGEKTSELEIGSFELATQDAIRIGLRDGEYRIFKGMIDEVRIYDRALSETEVQALFNAADANNPNGMVLQPGPVEGKDTCYGTVYVKEGNPDSNQLYFGGWGDRYYDFIEFDLSGTPPADTTSSAELYLYANATPTNDPALQVHIITESWEEASVSLYSNPSSVYYKEMSAITEGWNVVDITDLYKEWKNGITPNFGIELVPTYNNAANASFYSSDYMDDPLLRPKLVIE